MYKLLLVDDEKLVRRAVAQIIDWNSLGIDEIFQAEDGEQGLELAALHQVDIVLTDIRMPFMDGLELAEKLAVQLPNAKVLFLSGHDEFEYARRAITLNVVDYIVKPISSDGLKKVIEAVITVLDTERKSKELLLRMKSQLRKTLPILRERALFTLVTSKQQDPETLNLLSYCGAELTPGFICIIIEYAQTNNSSVEDLFVKGLILQELLEQHFHEYFIFPSTQNRYCVLAKNIAPDDFSVREEIISTLQSIRQIFSAQNQCYLNAGIGSCSRDIAQINTSYKEALHVLSYNTALGNDNTFDIIDYGYLDNIFVYPEILLDKLLNTLYLATDYNIPLDKLCEYLYNCINLSADNLKILAFEITLRVSKILIEILPDIQPLGEISRALNIITVTDFKKYLLELFCVSVEKINSKKRSKRQLTVNLAQQYVCDNLSDTSLSLNSVANALYVNSSYLSAMFKKETGETFIDFLTKQRIIKAKEIIEREDLHGYEIASRVGYSDPHYFSICFKKQTGLNPSEYKKVCK